LSIVVVIAFCSDGRHDRGLQDNKRGQRLRNSREAAVDKTREALLLGADSVQCRQAEEKQQTRKLIDVGSIHWNWVRGEAVTNSNSRRQVQLSAGLITC
jgi:hypothetical protein